MADQIEEELRKKLHNAVKKGKAIEADRKKLIVEHQKKIDEFEATLSTIKKEHSLMQQALEEQRAALSENNRAKYPPEEERSPSQQHSQLSSLNDQLRHELEEAQHRVKAAEEHLALASDGSASQSISGGNDDIIIAELRDEIEVLKEALDLAAIKIKEMQENEMHAQMQIFQKETEISDLKKAVKTAEKKARMIDDAIVDVQKAEQKATQANQELEAIKTSLLETTSREQEALQRITELESEQIKIDHAENKVRQADAAVTEAILKAKGAEEREKRALFLVETAKQQTHEAQTALQRLQEESEERNRKFSVIQATFLGKEGELKRALEIAEAETATARAAAHIAETEQENLKNKAEKAEREREDALARVEGLIADATQALNEKISTLETKLEQSEVEKTTLAEKLDDFEMNHKDEMSKITEMDVLLQNKDAQIDSLQVRIQEFEVMRQEFDEKLQLSAAEIASLEARCEDYKEELLDIDIDDVHSSNDADGSIDASRERVKKKKKERVENKSGSQHVEELEHRLADAEMRERLEHESAQARIVELETKNKELGWQISMLAKGGGAGEEYNQSTPLPSYSIHRKSGGGVPSAGAFAVNMNHDALINDQNASSTFLLRLTGLILRHRKHMMVGYFFFLHALVYFVATKGAHVN